MRVLHSVWSFLLFSSFLNISSDIQYLVTNKALYYIAWLALHFRGYKSPAFKWRTESEKLKAIGRTCPSASAHSLPSPKGKVGTPCWRQSHSQRRSKAVDTAPTELMAGPGWAGPWLFTWQAYEIKVLRLLLCSFEGLNPGKRLMFNINLGNTMSLFSKQVLTWPTTPITCRMRIEKKYKVIFFRDKLTQAFTKYDSPFSNLKNS